MAKAAWLVTGWVVMIPGGIAGRERWLAGFGKGRLHDPRGFLLISPICVAMSNCRVDVIPSGAGIVTMVLLID